MSDMFTLTGVTEPQFDTAAVQARAADYDALERGARDGLEAIVKAEKGIKAANNGNAQRSFSDAALGDFSIGKHLEVLAEAARETSRAYADAARFGGQAQAAMVSLSMDRGWQLDWARLSGKSQEVKARIIQQAQRDLLALEASGSGSVRAAFERVKLPDPFTLSYEDIYGRLDVGIRQDWEAASPEKRLKIMTCLLQKSSEAAGLPMPEVKVAKLDEGVAGAKDDRGQIVYLSEDHLRSGANPAFVLSTPAHELRHVYQDQRKYPWWQKRWGMTEEQKARWDRLEQPHVRTRGLDNDPRDQGNGRGYWARPIEVEARRAGRDAVNSLSYQEYQQCAG